MITHGCSLILQCAPTGHTYESALAEPLETFRPKSVLVGICNAGMQCVSISDRFILHVTWLVETAPLCTVSRGVIMCCRARVCSPKVLVSCSESQWCFWK